MNVKYFGQYLLENGYITREQLLEGIKHQKAINTKIGILAIDKEFMTAEQVEDILNVQKTENKPFGELAIRKNFLTKEQLDEILSLQKTDRIFLGEALVEKGFLSLEQLAQSLSKYKQSQQYADSAVSAALNCINPRYSVVVKDSIQIIQNMLVRLVDESAKVSGCFERTAKETTADYMIYQKVFGERNFILGLALKTETVVLFASRIFKREITTIDDYAQDGVKEFLNIVVGHICASFSNDGIKVETTPPKFVPYKDFSFDLVNASEIVISLLMAEDEFEIHFFMA